MTYNRLFKGTYIDYNVIEFFKSITLYCNIYKRVLFIVCNVYNGFNKCVYKWVFEYNCIYKRAVN